MAVLDYLSSKAKTWSNEVWDGLLRAVDARFKPLEEQLDIQRATTDAIVAKGLNVIEAELAPVVLQGEGVLIGIQGVKTDADAVYAALLPCGTRASIRLTSSPVRWRGSPLMPRWRRR